jgi:hypothetical protein
MTSALILNCSILLNDSVKEDIFYKRLEIIIKKQIPIFNIGNAYQHMMFNTISDKLFELFIYIIESEEFKKLSSISYWVDTKSDFKTLEEKSIQLLNVLTNIVQKYPLFVETYIINKNITKKELSEIFIGLHGIQQECVYRLFLEEKVRGKSKIVKMYYERDEATPDNKKTHDKILDDYMKKSKILLSNLIEKILKSNGIDNKEIIEKINKNYLRYLFDDDNYYQISTNLHDIFWLDPLYKIITTFNMHKDKDIKKRYTLALDSIKSLE